MPFRTHRNWHPYALTFLLGILFRGHATQVAFLHASPSRQALTPSILELPDRSSDDWWQSRANDPRDELFGASVHEIDSEWGYQGVILLVVVIISGVVSLLAAYPIITKAVEDETEKSDKTLEDVESTADQSASAFSRTKCAALAIFSILFVVSGLFLVVSLYSGAILKGVIEHFSMAFLGVEVHLDLLDISPFSGVLSAEGLTVFNPPGWKTEHLLTASSIYIDLNVGSLVFSLASIINIEELLVKGVNVIYEKSLHTSNVYELLEHVKGQIRDDREDSSTTDDSGSLTLDKVDILNITARAALYGVGGVDLVVPDISETNFEQKLQGENTASFAIDLILDILLTNVMGVLGTSHGADLIAMPTRSSSLANNLTVGAPS